MDREGYYCLRFIIRVLFKSNTITFVLGFSFGIYAGGNDTSGIDTRGLFFKFCLFFDGFL